MIEALDSHYLFVKNRIQTLNPQRKLGGIMDAMDWPTQVVDFETIYCLTLGEVPIDKVGASAAIPILHHTVQWTWLILGTNPQAGLQIRSRGDRYRKHYQIVKEILNGTYPRFCEKLQVTSDPATGNLVTAHMNPIEYITWTPVSISKKVDKASGLLYGIATVRITNMTDLIAA